MISGPSRPRARLRAGAVLLALAVAAVIAGSAEAGRWPFLRRLFHQTEAAHPHALWHVVHDLCVRDMAAFGNPAPCLKVDFRGRYALLKDPTLPTQLLLTPTDHIRGIESPALLAAAAPNYWQAAWQARMRLAQAAGRPLAREDVGLAVNSLKSRTQAQLHIHIDCVRPGVRRILAADMRRIHSRWSPFPHRLRGHRYQARWVSGEDLGGTDPFKLLAEGDPAARADMSRESLVVVGATRPGNGPGFILLSHRDGPAPWEFAPGEELLDHACRADG